MHIIAGSHREKNRIGKVTFHKIRIPDLSDVNHVNKNIHDISHSC